jgi:molybdopterin synthase sulfur carrier subunit
MRVTVHLASYLRALAGDRGAVDVDGDFASVADVLAKLWESCPAVRHRVVDETGRLRQHVNVFVGQENIRDRDGFATPIGNAGEVWILPAVSGG